VLSEPAAKRIIGARMTLAAATTGGAVLLDPGAAWPVSAGAWGFCVEADRPLLFADASGFFLVRWRDGWVERYAWTPSGALELVGSASAWAGTAPARGSTRSCSRCPHPIPPTCTASIPRPDPDKVPEVVVMSRARSSLAVFCAICLLCLSAGALSGQASSGTSTVPAT